MIAHMHTWLALKSDRRALTALEYAMIAGIIVAVIAVSFGVLASHLSVQFGDIGGNL